MTNIQYCYQDVNNAVAKSLTKGPVDIGIRISVLKRKRECWSRGQKVKAKESK